MPISLYTSLGDNGIARLAGTAIAGLGDNLQLRAVSVTRLHLTDNLHGTVGTAVVNSQDLYVLIGLVQDGKQALLKILLDVVDRYADSHQRLFKSVFHILDDKRVNNCFQLGMIPSA